jgi:hypothetical protein
MKHSARQKNVSPKQWSGSPQKWHTRSFTGWGNNHPALKN